MPTRRQSSALAAAAVLAVAVSVAVSAHFWREGAPGLRPGQVLRVALPLALAALAAGGRRRWAAWVLAALCALWAVGFGVPALEAAAQGVRGASAWVGTGLAYAAAAALAVVAARRPQAAAARPPAA